MALGVSLSAFAQNAEAPVIKWYGFVRNFTAIDSRESVAGTEDLYYYMPKDVNMVDGVDMNAIPSVRMAALTSRLGVDVTYKVEGYKVAAKIEADFYSGVSGVTGTAQFRMRQAYFTVAKDNRNWKLGQAWHPVAADLPDIFSLDSGVPFAPFSRTPQITFEQSFNGGLSLTASALWQMQYASYGPAWDADKLKYTNTMSANYIKYGCTPEIYLGVNYKVGSHVTRFGVDVLSIKPRNYAYDLETGKISGRVNDRITTANLFFYLQDKFGDWTVKNKLVFAQDGSHMNMLGGYGVSAVLDDGSWLYAPTSTIHYWGSVKRQKKDSRWVPQMYIGYIECLGTGVDIVGGQYYKNNAPDIARMFRVQPEIMYNLGKLSFGLEYMCTGVQYGKPAKRMVAVEDLHWVLNHRLQILTRFSF